MDTTMRTHNHTATERREAVVDAAITEFAQKGLHGTATEDIARRAGISQPYIFRLFGTKKDLFLAAVNRVCDRVVLLFAEAAQSGQEDVLAAMGKAYSTLLGNREELLLLLHAFAASGDPEVQAQTRKRMESLFAQVKAASGADDLDVRAFFAEGMLLTVLAALDAPQVLGYPNWQEVQRACGVGDQGSFVRRL
jgi:AcrR family transcriptional regulator